MYSPAEPDTKQEVPEEGRLTVGASERGRERAPGSGSSIPMEGSDDDVRLERRVARMKQQETKSGASEVAGN